MSQPDSEGFLPNLRLRDSSGLLKHLLVALATLAVVYTILRFFGVTLFLVPWVVFALATAALIWVLRTGPEPLDSPVWVENQSHAGSALFQSDLATRRIADTIAGAQPGREFSTHQLAHTLRELASQRLVRLHKADPANPLTTGERQLTPQLLSYLTSVETGDSPSVSRRTLHRYLKEIESL